MPTSSSAHPHGPAGNSVSSRVASFEQTVAELKNQIETPEFRQLSEIGRKRIRQLSGIDQRLDDLDRDLRHAWRDILDKQRHEVNDPQQEATLFGQALTVAQLYGQQRQLHMPKPPPASPDVAAGLGALADGDYDRALDLLHVADRSAIEQQRRLLSSQWLVSILSRLANREDHDPAWVAESRRQIERVLRVGPQESRDQAHKALHQLDTPPRRPQMPIIILAGAIGLLVIIVSLAIVASIMSGGRSDITPTAIGATDVVTTPGTSLTILVVSPAPTATPAPISVSGISPAEFLLNTQTTTPIQIHITGVSIDRLIKDQITLLPQDGDPLAFKVIQQDAQEIILEATAPPAIRQITLLQVLIDGEAVGSITLRSGEPEYTVSGVLGTYADYDPLIQRDDQGYYTWLYSDPDTGSTQVGKLRNQELVRVSQQADNGWFYVDVIDKLGGDPTGLAGWVQPWLVLNSGVPERPTPTPTRIPTRIPTLVPTFTAIPQPSPTVTEILAATPTVAEAPSPTPQANPTNRTFSASAVLSSAGAGNDVGGACVVVRVYGKDGPIKGAVGNVNKGSSTPPEWSTDADGEAQVCALSQGEWNAVLYYIPGKLPLAGPVPSLFPLAGADGEIVTVTFQEQ